MVKSILQNIFSIKKVDGRKQLRVLGINIMSRHVLRFHNGKIKVYKSYPIPSTSYRRMRLENVSQTRCNDNTIGEPLLGLASYQILHRLKEEKVRNKLKEGKKIRVCFFLDTISRFSSMSVYQAMKSNPLFEPFLVLYHARDNELSNDREWTQYQNSYDSLKQKEDAVYAGYDENREYIPIEHFNPDIIFVSSPYLSYGSSYLSMEYLILNYLVCYVNYGLNTINLYNYHYNNKNICTAWKHFVETREDYAEIMRYSKYCGVNSVLMGFPKLDAYSKDFKQYTLPQKIDNGNPIVIFAPHWSIKLDRESIDLATFHLYYDYIFSFVKKYPHINFVLKPHPNLHIAVIEKKIMTEEEYTIYVEEWDQEPNGLYLPDGEYIELFKRSHLLITDSGSFIGEWLPSEHPCIYLVNPRRDPQRYVEGFSLMGRKILEQYYLCYTRSDIDRYFKMLMEEKNDVKKKARKELKESIFINIGSAGEKIVEYLDNLLSE